MPRNPVLTFRLPEPVFDALVRERHEHHLNVSGWARAAVLEAFQRDFPDAARTDREPAKSAETKNEGSNINTPISGTDPIPGWKPKLHEGAWAAIYEGDTSKLPDELVGRRITVKPRNSTPWTATITAVVERSHERVVVTHSGKPR